MFERCVFFCACILLSSSSLATNIDAVNVAETSFWDSMKQKLGFSKKEDPMVNKNDVEEIKDVEEKMDIDDVEDLEDIKEKLDEELTKDEHKDLSDIEDSKSKEVMEKVEDAKEQYKDNVKEKVDEIDLDKKKTDMMPKF